jgi:serine/threonine-protein kinase SRPK3
MCTSVLPVSVFFSGRCLNLSYSVGNLLRIDSLIPVSIEVALTNYGVEDIGPTAQFIRGCLCFDPDERPSIKEIQSHTWLRFAWVCGG